jgi:phthiodiolone/phenolphthiodiolone dimycocerosates ketoreductase
MSSVTKSCQRLDDQGYDAMWFVDHLMGFIPQSVWTPDITPLAERISSPHVFLDPYITMAAAATLTERISIGSSVTDLVRRHPVTIAQSFLTLDHISNGRVILGVGSGERENIEPYGFSFSKRFAKFRESLEIIQLMWKSTEPVNFDGKFWKLRDAILDLKPVDEKKPPPIWIAAHGPKMLKITAEFGDGWLPIAISPKLYGEGYSQIEKERKRLNRDHIPFTGGIWSWVILDSDHEECHRIMNSPLGRFYALMLPPERWEEMGLKHPLGNTNLLTDFIPTQYDRETILNAMDEVPEEVTHEFYVHGNVDEVLKKIEEYHQQGLKHIILGNMTGTFDYTKNRSSYGLMKEILDYVKSLR